MSIEIKHPEPHNVYAMKKMWQTSFGDTDEYINDFFERCFKPEQALVAYNDLKPVGMLFTLPVTLRMNDKDYNGFYLYAVCTKEDYRNKGVMTALERGAVQFAESKDLDFVSLVPQTQSLFGMYEKIGYYTTFYLSQKTFLVLSDDFVEGAAIATCGIGESMEFRRKFIQTKPAYIEFDEFYQNYRFDEFTRAGGNLLKIRVNNVEYFAACYIKKDVLIIKETTMTLDILKKVMPLIASRFDIAQIMVKGIKGAVDTIKPYGMMKWLRKDITHNMVKTLNPYMNMMLD